MLSPTDRVIRVARDFLEWRTDCAKEELGRRRSQPNGTVLCVDDILGPYDIAFRVALNILDEEETSNV